MEKFLNILKAILNVILTIIIIVGIIFIGLYIIGIEPSVVQSGSMEPQIETGSVCFINKLTKYEDIKENDVIAFKLPTGVGVTHRVIKITNDGFKTKGDNNDTEDLMIITKDNYIGKNIFSIPKVGYAVKQVQTTRGKIILGTIILVVFLTGVLIGEPSKKKKQKEENLKQNDQDGEKIKEDASDNEIQKENISKEKMIKKEHEK